MRIPEEEERMKKWLEEEEQYLKIKPIIDRYKKAIRDGLKPTKKQRIQAKREKELLKNART